VGRESHLEREAARLQAEIATLEQQVRDHDLRDHQLFQNALNGVAYCKMIYEEGHPVDFLYLEVNDVFYTITELGPVTGKRASEVIPGIQQSDPELIEIYGKVASTGVATRFERYVVAMSEWFSVSVYCPRSEHFVAVFEITTERKLTEAKLIASEERFRTLFDQSSEAIMIACLETRQNRYANPAALQLFGYTLAELRARGVADIAPPAELQRVLAEFEAIASGRQTLSSDVPCLRKDGTVVYADITATLLTIDGEPMVAGFFRDVTERRRAARALAASEARYHRLFEAAGDGIVIVDAATGLIEDVNPSLLVLTGRPRMELIGQPVEVLDLSDPANRVQGADPEGVYSELSLRAPDGTVRSVERSSATYSDGDHELVRYTFRDITERTRAVAEQGRLAMAIAQASDAMCITDTHHDIVYVNPAFEAVTGYALAEVIGRNPRLLKSGIQDAAFYKALHATIESGHVWRGRLVNRRKDGTLYTQDGAISPVRDRDGTVTSFVSVARDVTEELELQAKFLQAQKMEAVGRFAGGVAHDFNNMLSVVLSYVELIAEDLRSDDPMRADVDEIKQAALRASQLTRQLLAFSRQQVLEPKVLCVDEVVGGTEKMLRRLLNADIEITILPTSRRLNIRADEGQLVQVLMNLAVNASDAMLGGGKLTIEMTAVDLDDADLAGHDARPGPYVLLAVADTGVGMAAETRARIFDPFFTTKQPGKGTGLGLATVFGIVKQSGGHLQVVSEPGAGTTFKIYFPEVDTEPESVRPEEVSTVSPRGHATILLVEDDDQVRPLAAEILRRAGYAVELASSAGEAILIGEQHPARIDLLLTDVVLPRMGGQQLAARLVSMRPAMKVLFMSGYTGDVVREHGVLETAGAFLQKPLTPALLIRKVQEILARSGSGSIQIPTL